MKKFFILFVMVLSLFILGGCVSTILQGVAIIGEAGGIIASDKKIFSGSNSADSELKIGKELEKWEINNNCTVNLSEATKNGKEYYLFQAFDNDDKWVAGVVNDRNDKNDAKKMEKFFSADELEKKQFICERFLVVAKYDLGPIDEPAVAETPYAPECDIEKAIIAERGEPNDWFYFQNKDGSINETAKAITYYDGNDVTIVAIYIPGNEIMEKATFPKNGYDAYRGKNAFVASVAPNSP